MQPAIASGMALAVVGDAGTDELWRHAGFSVFEANEIRRSRRWKPIFCLGIVDVEAGHLLIGPKVASSWWAFSTEEDAHLHFKM
jgi:hypothetical protein